MPSRGHILHFSFYIWPRNITGRKKARTSQIWSQGSWRTKEQEAFPRDQSEALTKKQNKTHKQTKNPLTATVGEIQGAKVTTAPFLMCQVLLPARNWMASIYLTFYSFNVTTFRVAPFSWNYPKWPYSTVSQAKVAMCLVK